MSVVDALLSKQSLLRAQYVAGLAWAQGLDTPAERSSGLVACAQAAAALEARLEEITDFEDAWRLALAEARLAIDTGAASDGIIGRLQTTPYRVNLCTPAIHPGQRMLRWPLLHEVSISDGGYGSTTHGDGLIGAAERTIAGYYGAAAAHMFVDGSTGALRAVVEWIAATAPAARVAVGREVHKAVVHHLDTHRVDWTYINDRPDTLLGDFDARLPVAAADLTALPEATTHVLVNGVTYEGLVGNHRAWREALDQRGQPPILIVDTGWGAHLPFHSDTAPLWPGQDADIVTTSSHKQGGSSQGGALLLITDRDANPVAPTTTLGQRLTSLCRVSVTTSPGFPLLASIEEATRALATEAADPRGSLAGAIVRAADLRRRLAAVDGLAVLDEHAITQSEVTTHRDTAAPSGTITHRDTSTQRDIATPSGTPAPSGAGGASAAAPASQVAGIDPLKIVVGLDADRGDGAALSAALADHGIVVEQRGHASVTLLITYLTTDADLDHVDAVVADHLGATHTSRVPAHLPPPPPLRVAPLTADERAGAELVVLDVDPAGQITIEGAPDLAAIVGRRAVDIVTPYPPGIPVVVPGAEITVQVLDHLVTLIAKGFHLVSGGSAIRSVTDRSETAVGLWLSPTQPSEDLSR